MDLMIATYGFFLYPVVGGKCEVIAAPAIRKGRMAHKCSMFMSGEIETWEVESVPETNKLVLSGCLLRVGVRSGATLGNFGLVVNFGSLACGAKLKRDWDTDDPEDTEVQLELSGGSLVAYPDAYTNKNKWNWRDCNNVDTSQQVTSLVVYHQPSWTGALEFLPRSNGGTKGRIVFKGAAKLALLHKPTAPEPSSPEADAELDKEHGDATRSLCAPKGATPITPSRVNPTAYYEEAVLDEAIRKFLGLGGVYTDTKGRPNCGARQLSV